MTDHEAFREIPEGRTPESFNYKIESIWGHVVDTLYTDDRDTANRIIGAELAQSYTVRVTTAHEVRTYAEVVEVKS